MHPVQIARQARTVHHALQKPAELAAFLALAADLEPKVIVEIGSDTGGTLWAWRQLGARVIGVSLEEGPYRGVEKGPLNNHGCEILNGDSHDPDTRVALVGMLKGDPIDILFIDGDHTFAGVKSDFEMFSDLVRPGGIIALHDICDHPKNPSVKVKAFWDSVEWGFYREEIITGDRTWGGIGVFRVPTGAEVAA